MKRSHLVIIVLFALLAACGKSDKAKQPATSSTTAHDSNASTSPTITYRAFGNEPFWSVTISDIGLRFDSPEDSSGVRFPAVQPVARGDTLDWFSKSDRGSIDVRIWPAACSDGMSDKQWALTGTVRLNEMAYTGCAEKMPPVR
jgi:uncharacterized membrane protein